MTDPQAFQVNKMHGSLITLVSKKSERTSGLTESSILVSRWQVIQKLAIVVFVAHFFGRVYFDTRKGGGGDWIPSKEESCIQNDTLF